MNLPTRLLLSALAASAACGAALADEPVYRGVDAKGNVVYSNSPSGLKGAKKVPLPEFTLSISPPSADAPRPPPAPGSTAGPSVSSQAASQAAANAANAQAAQRQLQDAQAAFEQGKEPEPGERLGTSGGGSRLAPAYFERQERLAKDLAAARERAQEAGMDR